MEYSFFSKEKVNRRKKKVIPWHVQKRYMESLSQLSLNQTIATAFYKKEINSLKRNNKHLALALQQSRYLTTEKENLMLENGKILDIVNFSRLKLMDMATNMKQATACLDETLLLLNSAIKDNLLKCSPNNRNYRNEFKSKLQELNIEPIKEVIESASKNLESLNKNALSCVHKGKISRVDDCTDPPNKKCKLGKKGEKVKRNIKNVPKSSEESSTAPPNATFKNTSVKDSKKCGSARNIKSQRKKSLPKSSNIESPSSSKFPATSSNLSLQGKNKQKHPDKKCKSVKVMLTDIAEAFVKLGTESSPETSEPNSSMGSTSFKCFAPNSDEDNMLIEKYLSSEIASKASSGQNTCSPPFASTINDVEVPLFASAINDAEVPPFESINDTELYPFETINDTEVYPFETINKAAESTSSWNTSNFSLKNLSSAADAPVLMDCLPALPEENEDFMFEQTSTVVKMHPIEEGENNTEQNNGRHIKNSDLEKDKRSYKSRNSIVSRRVQFYFDEDSIESVDGKITSSSKNNRIQKNISKGKARKTVSNVKRNISSKTTALKPNCILPDNVSKLGKNSFLVTAEVHSPPNGVHYAQEMKSKKRNEECVTEKREPRVVLTDIFKSNRGLLSEMVGNGLCENRCLQKTNTISAEDPVATIPVIDVETANMDCENNEVDNHLLEHRSVIKRVFCQERSKETKNNSKKQPTVVLKDIVNCRKAFKKCLNVYSNEKTRKNSASYLSHDKENRCLQPADRKIIDERGQRRRGKVVSYKEPSLTAKMRRLI